MKIINHDSGETTIEITDVEAQRGMLGMHMECVRMRKTIERLKAIRIQTPTDTAEQMRAEAIYAAFEQILQFAAGEIEYASSSEPPDPTAPGTVN